MSGNSRHMREGIQVVRMSQKPGQRFEVDEEALASVLLRNDVRNLPVVVVSVAGAYRGGKSFILDFFLRYLKASRESQLNTTWLGNEDDLLEGFDWRGGAQSNTKGIHLWPEPIIVTLEETKEKVAVLLMDTQGTFDTESDMGDNSTIFALSTLLSSVQIYNLRANIGEDDLQHLQLFTEYGKLACNAEGKAFQSLLFLIRDWMSPYEHPYGYTGGQALMDLKLMTKPNQKKQLLEVRTHIHSCFEKLQCFLMPHPGLNVADERFRGRLSDITDQFRTSLLELVPSLFDQNNLMPKTISGDKVQAQGLLEFFMRYVEIFNSDDMPEATTIFQATVDACMTFALREAREYYAGNMAANIIDGQSVLKSMMETWHRETVAASIAHFQAKKKLGSQEEVAVYVADLEKELEARLSQHLWQNDAKIREDLSEAEKVYKDVVHLVSEDTNRLCLHEKDMKELHSRAEREALETFDRTRPRVPQDEDTDRDGLIRDLNQFYKQMKAVNVQNNKNAILEARELYLSRMKAGMKQNGVSTEELEKQHCNALKAAVRHFLSLRSQPTQQSTDPDQETLEQEIDRYFEEFEKTNASNSLTSVRNAVYAYNNYVTSQWGPPSCCYHPRALKELHERAQTKALEQFQEGRAESLRDEYKDNLISTLADRLSELESNNDYNNRQAVDQAFREYTHQMNKHTRPSGVLAILVVPVIVKAITLPERHDDEKTKALNMFKGNRRGPSYSNDSYLDDLEERIDDSYRRINNPLAAIGREIGL